MAVTKQKKEEILKELIDKFGKSKSVVFADYRGLDVAGISDLRRKLQEEESEMKVAKKTLINLAAKEQGIDEIDNSAMEGPVAATFSYEDALSGIKVLFQFAKDNENLKLLGGIIDGKVVGSDVVNQYAKLPSREELLAKFMGSINSPVSGFAGTLGNVLGGFVRVMGAIKDSMPTEEASKEEVKEKVKEEAKAEEAAPAEEKAEEKPAEEVKEEATAEEKSPEEAPKEEKSVEEKAEIETPNEADEAEEKKETA